MRTIISLPQKTIDALARICRDEKISRAEAIRRAIDIYIRKKISPNGQDSAFGIWKAKKIDSLAFVDRLRSEWESGEGGS